MWRKIGAWKKGHEAGGIYQAFRSSNSPPWFFIWRKCCLLPENAFIRRFTSFLMQFYPYFLFLFFPYTSFPSSHYPPPPPSFIVFCIIHTPEWGTGKKSHERWKRPAWFIYKVLLLTGFIFSLSFSCAICMIIIQFKRHVWYPQFFGETLGQPQRKSFFSGRTSKSGRGVKELFLKLEK